ncbi:MAG: hypothetical protein U1C74_15175 [Phenylobacterium sp.]|nr:hypothetical protein [Phenylobacterium sp.]
MSEVKIHKVRYRLANQLREGSKLSIATALKGAKSRVEALEPALLLAIEGEFVRLDEGVAALQLGAPDGLTLVYDTANGLLGLAGAAPRLGALGKAALSLCELLDGLNGAIPEDLRPIAVHIDALRILRHELPERDQFMVLAGLSKVRAHASRAPGG